MAIIYQIGFRAETKDLKTQLSTIQKDIDTTLKNSGGRLDDVLAKGIQSAGILANVLKKAQTEKGTSFIDMNRALKAAGSSQKQMAADLSGAGMKNSLNTFLQTFAAADRNLTGINKKVKEMQRVLLQSMKFNFAMGLQNFAMGQIQSAITWARDLNKALTDIAVVAPEVANKMDDIAVSIVNSSKELRVAAKDYAEASLIFYQQGLDPEEVKKRTDITIKAAAASGQNVKDMSEQLTAVWNTYRMEGDELERAASIASKLGAETAAAFEDISVGMQIAASGASMLGVSYESLAAIMTTVRETTLQSASTIGNAYKTIFARFSNLKTSGEDAGESLGRITSQLASLGINVLDSAGDLRDLDDVIMQLGLSWDNYSRKQQIAISQVVGGVRQYQQFLALMQNFDKYQESLASAQAETGGAELARQYAETLKSVDSAMVNSSEAWKRAFAQVFNDDAQLGFFRTLENIGKTVEGIVTGLGGLQGILVIAGALLASKIAPAVSSIGTAFKTWKNNLTLEGQKSAIDADIDAMKQGIQEAAGKGEVNQYQLKKLEITRQTAKEEARLNEIIKKGTEQEKIKAQQLLNQLKTNQEVANSSLDELETLEKSNKKLKENVEFRLKMAKESNAGEKKDKLIDDAANANMAVDDAESDASAIAKEIAATKKLITQKENLIAKSAEEVARKQEVVDKIAAQVEAERAAGDIFSQTHQDKIAALATAEQELAAQEKSGENATKALESAKEKLTVLEEEKKSQQKIVTEQKIIAKQLEDQAKAAAEAETANKKDQVTLKASSDILQSMTKYTEALAEGLEGDHVGDLKAELEDVKKELQEIAKLDGPEGDAATEMLVRIEEAMKDLDTELIEPNIGTFFVTMANNIDSLHDKPEIIAQITQAMRESGASAEELENALRRIREAQEAGGNAAQEQEISFEQLGAEIGKVAGGVAIVTNAFSNLFETWSTEGPSLGLIIGVIGQLIVGIGMLAISLQSFIGLMKTQGIVSLQTAKQAVINSALKVAGLTAEAAQATMAAGGMLALQKATLLALPPFVVITAAIVALIIVITGIINIVKKHNKNLLESAEAANAAAKKHLEVRDALQDVSKEIQDLRKDFNDGSITLSEYNKKLSELLDKLEELRKENPEIAIEFTGDVNKLLSDMEAQSEDQLAASSNQANFGKKQYEDMVASKNRWSWNPRTTLIGDSINFGVGYSGQETSAITNILKNNGAKSEGVMGQKFSIEDVAKNYDEIVAGLETISSDLAEKFKTKIAEMEGMTTYIENVNTLEENTKLVDYKDTAKEFSEKGSKEQIADINAKRKAQEDYVKAQDESQKKGQEIAELEEKRNKLPYHDQRIDDQIAALKKEKKELDKLIPGYADQAEAARDFERMTLAGTDQTSQANAVIYAGLNILESSLDKRLYSETEWLDLQEKATQMQIDGESQYIAALGSSSFEIQRQSGLISELAEQRKHMSEAETTTDQAEQLQEYNDIAEKLRSSGIDVQDLTADFYSLTKSEQEAALAAQEYMSQMAQATTAQEKVGQMDNDISATEQRLKQANQDVKKYQAEVDENPNDKEQLEKLAEATERVTANTEVLQQQQENRSQLALEQDIEEQKQKRVVIERVNELTAAVQGLSAASFNGNANQQIDALNIANQTIQELNSSLGVLGTAAEIPELTSNFLYLSDAEKETALAAQNLLIVEAEMALSEGRLAQATETLADARVNAAEAGQAQQDEARAQLAAAEEEFALAEQQKALTVENKARTKAQMFDLDFNDIDVYADHLESLAQEAKKTGKSIDGLSQDLAGDREAALEVATTIMRLNKGIDSLADNFEDWNDILTNSKRTPQEYAKALNEMRGAVGDLLGVDPSVFTEKFLTATETLKLLGKAATGNVEAIEDLQRLAAQDYIVNVVLEGEDQSIVTEVTTMFDELQGMLNERDLTVGAKIDDKEFIDKANEIIKAGNMTAEKVNAAFGMIGLHPNLTMISQPNTTQKPIIRTSTTVHQQPDITLGDGSSVSRYSKVESSEVIGHTPVTEHILVPKLEVTPGADGASESFTLVSKPSMSNYSPQNAGGGKPGGGGGGGGSKPAQASRKAPQRERYVDTNAALKTVSRSLDRINAAEGQSFGLNRLAILEKKNLELQKQGGLYSKLAKEAEAYLKIDDRLAKVAFGSDAKGKETFLTGKMGDQARLQQMLKTLGTDLTATFDNEGFVTNAEQMLDALIEMERVKFDAVTREQTNDAGQIISQYISTQAQAEHESLAARIDIIKEQMSTVDEAAQTVRDNIDQGVAQIHTWLSNKLQENQYKLDLKLQINQSDLRMLERLLDKLGDRSYVKTMSLWNEQATLAVKRADALKESTERVFEIINNVDTSSAHRNFFVNGDGMDFKGFGEEAWAEFEKNGTVTEEMMSKLTEMEDQLFSTIEDLEQINRQMWEMFNKAIQDYISDFDNLLSVYDSHAAMLDSWLNIWKVAGKQWSNQRLSIDLLNKSIDNQSSKVQGLNEKYQFMNEELQNAQKLYELALSSGQEEGIVQQRYNEWQELERQTLEAKSNMMSELSGLMDMITNAAQEAATVIVREFTEGLNALFSEVSSAMEMYGQKRAIDTFFLHDEDLAFELSKMVREIGKDMENVTNPDLLQTYSEWLDKVNGIKDSGVKMTQTELDILKAEFDLEKAKAAFEDQQQQKNTMRLARDASGNWSYLYSNDGDDNQSSEEDIEQKIHNIRKMHRDAADEASEMWLQVWTEYNNYVAEIDWQRYEQNDKYRREVDTRMSWYEEQMDLHAAQIVKHNEIIDRAFSETTLSVIVDMADMSQANDRYKYNTEQMTIALKNNYDEYRIKVQQSLAAIGISQENLEAEIRDSTNQIMRQNADNEKSIRQLRQTAVAEMSGIMQQVTNWAERWKSEIAGVIQALEQLIQKIQQMRIEQSNGTGATTNQNVLTENRNILDNLRAKENLTSVEATYLAKLEEANRVKLSGEDSSKYNTSTWMKEVREAAQIMGYKLDANGIYVPTFDTGGLATGPMPAFLAQDGQKELVLNNNDTENMLAAVQIMRDSIAYYLSSIGVRQAGIISAANGSGTVENNNQNPVIINADFPNVSAREEIEAAFANLVNQAAQYQLKPRDN